MTILVILVVQPAPKIIAASSGSTPICAIDVILERVVKGKYITPIAIIMSSNVPYSAGIGPRPVANNTRYAAPNPIPGTRYGKNDICLRYLLRLLCCSRTTVYPTNVPIMPQLIAPIPATLILVQATFSKFGSRNKPDTASLTFVSFANQN